MKSPALLLQLTAASIVLILCAVMSAKTAKAQQPPISADYCAQPSGQNYNVVAIIDARTIKLDDGSQVRLTGTLPPFRPFAAGNGQRAHDRWPPLVQARAALSKIALGRSVQLAWGQQKTNRYGQILAQVYLLPRSNSTNNNEKPLWMQAYLIANGLARATAIPDMAPCAAQLIVFEQKAMSARAGLWQFAAYAIRDAARLDTLNPLIGSFQIVEGVIDRQGGNRSRIYLNFGSDWRRDFTVGIARKQTRAFRQAGMPLRNLRGRRVRVRGWLEWRGGPYIQALSPAQIELLPD